MSRALPPSWAKSEPPKTKIQVASATVFISPHCANTNQFVNAPHTVPMIKYRIIPSGVLPHGITELGPTMPAAAMSPNKAPASTKRNISHRGRGVDIFLDEYGYHESASP